jgi:copper(I)-binding protein
MSLRTITLFSLSMLLSGAALAHEYKAGDITIAHPFARATVPGQPSAAAYIGLDNAGKAGDKLLGASSPAAKSVEIHTMSMDNNVMRMREVKAIDIAPGTKIAMKPGDGYHLMMMGLKKELKAGDKVPLTLVFEKFGPLEVSVSVEDRTSKAAVHAPVEQAHEHKH